MILTKCDIEFYLLAFEEDQDIQSSFPHKWNCIYQIMCLRIVLMSHFSIALVQTVQYHLWAVHYFSL